MNKINNISNNNLIIPKERKKRVQNLKNEVRQHATVFQKYMKTIGSKH